MITRGFVTNKIVTREFGVTGEYSDIVNFVLYIDREKQFGVEL